MELPPSYYASRENSRESKEEAIKKAREWACSNDMVLNPLPLAYFEEEVHDFPTKRSGWTMVVFCKEDYLDGEQFLWFNQTTGQVEWPDQPRPSLLSRLIRLLRR